MKSKISTSNCENSPNFDNFYKKGNLRCKNCTSSEGDELELQKILRSKIWTSSWGGARYVPYAFTEQGIYMLMTVLKGEQATAQSKALIRLFKQMKDYIAAENKQLLGNDGIAQIALQTAQNTRDIAIHSAGIREFSGEVHDMRENLGKVNLDLQKVMAKKSVLIVDDYLDVKTLDLLRCVAKGVSVKIFSEQHGRTRLTESMLADFRAARPDVELDDVRTTGNIFHDRYIYLDFGTDSEKLFHCGASSKDAGNKITTIMQLEDIVVYRALFERLLENEK